jgi:hypothetical protein
MPTDLERLKKKSKEEIAAQNGPLEKIVTIVRDVAARALPFLKPEEQKKSRKRTDD